MKITIPYAAIFAAKEADRAARQWEKSYVCGPRLPSLRVPSQIKVVSRHERRDHTIIQEVVDVVLFGDGVKVKATVVVITPLSGCETTTVDPRSYRVAKMEIQHAKSIWIWRSSWTRTWSRPVLTKTAPRLQRRSSRTGKIVY